MKNLFYLSLVCLLSGSTLQAQNVGIGTASPGTKLHVAGAIASTPNTGAAASSITIPDNTSVYRLSATAGVQANALNLSAPTEGQFLTIYNEDGDAATFAGQSIAAASGVATFQYINSGWRLVSTNQSSGGGGGTLAGDVTGPLTATVVGKINGVSLAGLGTGILKNTTGTGIPSIATAGTDYVAGGTGSSSQIAYFTASGVINGSANHTFAVNPAGATAVFATNTSTTTGSAGLLGTATGNGNVSGVQGSTTATTTGASGLGGFANGTTGGTNAIYGENFSSAGVGVYGVCSSTSASATTFAVYGQNTATQVSSGSTHIGTYGKATGGSYNAALYDGGGEVVIANSNTLSSTAQLPRGWSGSIFTQAASATTTGGRIWYSTGGYNFYVNSSGSADYSEYFYAADQNLAVGEVVALDGDHANGVRRARPSDAGRTVGIVSIGGTRYNDTENGNRANDPHYTNVGMLGQVPVLISPENGDIKPGDALTISTKYRGRVTKAAGACRIVGYATTHFPYVAGEKDYETDINGGAALRLAGDHVMCYLNVGWYEPANSALGDGEELPVTETARDMMARINETLVSPRKAELDAHAETINQQAEIRAHNLPAQTQPVPVAVKK